MTYYYTRESQNDKTPATRDGHSSPWTRQLPPSQYPQPSVVVVSVNSQPPPLHVGSAQRTNVHAPPSHDGRLQSSNLHAPPRQLMSSQCR